ncbi:MAG: fructose 1,6-bisphosphatase [Candidatus Bipolaricaulota bacterium]|nr:fructose 1,6-bisphosphatase [Candidatus Bipolaricaulota bacterium]
MGNLQSPEPVGAFDHPCWDWVRDNIARKAHDTRTQAFSGPAMRPYADIEYGGITERMRKLAERFHRR